MRKKSLIIMVSLVVSFFMFAANASAAWYTCYIVQVVPWSDGQVRLQLAPGPGEDSFSGTAKAYIDTTKPGGKNMLATVLTAISLGVEVTVMAASVPQWNPPVECTGVGLVAP